MSNEQDDAKPRSSGSIMNWISIGLVAIVCAAGAWKKTGGQTSAPASLKEAPVAGVRKMDIQELGYFPYDAVTGGTIPDEVRKLNGTTVRLSGYMIPLVQAQEVTSFALVPSRFSCCGCGAMR